MTDVRMTYWLVNGQSIGCTVDEDTADEMVQHYEDWLKGERYAFAGQRLVGANGFTIFTFDKVTHVSYTILNP